MEKRLEIINELHEACRKLMKTEIQLSDITECQDVKFLSGGMDALLEAAIYILREDLTLEQLNRDMFST